RPVTGLLREPKGEAKRLDDREIIRQLQDDFFEGLRDEKDGKTSKPGGNDGGEGGVKKKLKELSEDWGRLPEKEREKALEEVVRDLPPRYREAVTQYFEKLGKQVPGGKKPPQVWKPSARPTFARVYVGDGNALELVSLHVTVAVEGPRARTLVDHVFR